MLSGFESFKSVRAFVFDVDGVLSKETSPLNEEGDPVRTANVKDGFAIRVALSQGFPVAVITGGFMERVRLRHEKLGVRYYYDKARNKSEYLQEFLNQTRLPRESVLFMGDDLVDYKVMQQVGFPTCPQDAVSEIKAISTYISPANGGEGCVRDVIEQTLKTQGLWPAADSLIDQVF